MIELYDLLEKISDGKRVMLFIGSGFSIGAKNHNNNRLPIGSQLAKYIYTKCGIKDGDSDLQFAAEKYIEKYGISALIQYIREIFTISEYESYYDSFSQQKWFRIYTTNYDDLLENIFIKNKKLINSASIEQDIASYRNKSNLVIHLNGYIKELSQSNIDNFFKLIGRSYLVNTITSSTWYEQLKADINIADVILFIGFSLDGDLDIKRLFFSDAHNIKKTYFVVWDKETDLNIEKLGRYGQVCRAGVELFSIEMSKKKIEYEEFDKNALTCFEQRVFTNSLKEKVNDSDVFNLLFWGNINQKLIEQSISTATSDYVILRNSINTIVDCFNDDLVPVIHSNMGNGKTLCLNILSYQLSRNGYKVFYFNKPYQNIDEEIEFISKENGKIVIIIDRYNLFYHTTKKILAQLLSKDIKVVLSERTNIYDVTIANLENSLNFNHHGIDLNILTDNDINEFVKLLNKYNFWGDIAHYTDNEKKDYLQRKCKKQLSFFLIDIIKSKDIKKRIEAIIKTMTSSESGFKLFILLLVSDVIGLSPDINDLQELINFEANLDILRQDSDFQEIFDFKTGQVVLKSSILSQCLIELLGSNELLFSTIYNASKVAEKRHTSFSKLFVKELTMYGNLEKIFRNKNQHRKHIIDFYMLAKDFRLCKENPQFWLQYSIAMIALNELDQADVYIQNAYSFAHTINNYDTFQIDNQYGKLLMEQCILGDIPSHFDVLQKVQTIITNPRQMRDNRHYPYSVGMKYAEYYKKYYSNLSSTEKNLFLDYCRELHLLAISSIKNVNFDASKKRINIFIQVIEGVLRKIDPEYSTKGTF